MLYLGTMFAPTEDRGAPGMGFTHKPGDVVVISTPALGSLANAMTTSGQGAAVVVRDGCADAKSRRTGFVGLTYLP